jgi:hypothetical protein
LLGFFFIGRYILHTAPPLGAGEVERKLMLRVVLKLFLFLMRETSGVFRSATMPTIHAAGVFDGI